MCVRIRDLWGYALRRDQCGIEFPNGKKRSGSLRPQHYPFLHLSVDTYISFFFSSAFSWMILQMPTAGTYRVEARSRGMLVGGTAPTVYVASCVDAATVNFGAATRLTMGTR